MIRFRCPECERPLRVEDKQAGRQLPCPDCGEEVAVPAVDGAEDEALDLRPRGVIDDDVDMTPMCDIVFQLLLFFMVTATYTLQKTLEVPPPDKQQNAQEARTITELENDDDYVIVRVARDNTIWVDEQETPSRQEVLAKLREAMRGGQGTSSRGPSSLLVMADGEARHETVIAALDAGNAVGMENIRLATVDEDDL